MNPKDVVLTQDEQTLVVLLRQTDPAFQKFVVQLVQDAALLKDPEIPISPFA